MYEKVEPHSEESNCSEGGEGVPSITLNLVLCV